MRLPVLHPRRGCAFFAGRGTGPPLEGVFTAIAAGAKRTYAGADEMQDRTKEVDLTKVIFDMSMSLDGSWCRASSFCQLPGLASSSSS